MKRQGRRGDLQPFGNPASRHALGPRLHQQAEDLEPVFLRKGGKGCNGSG